MYFIGLWCLLFTSTCWAQSYDYLKQGVDWTGYYCLDEMSKNQSPVDITKANGDPYGTATFTFQNIEASFTVWQYIQGSISIKALTPKDTMTVDSSIYNLVFYDLHAPSEHTINGIQSAMEIQIAFGNGVDNIVLSHLLDPVGTGGVAQSIPLLDAIASEERLNLKNNVKFSTTDLAYDYFGQGMNALAAMGDGVMYTYNGSYTFPPCGENVTWYIAATPITVDPSTLAAAALKLKYEGTLGNYRAIKTDSFDLSPFSALVNVKQLESYTFNQFPTTSTAAPTTLTTEPTTSTAEPSTSTVEPSTSTAAPTTSTTEPTTLTAEPSTSTVEPSTLTAEPSTSTAEPSTSTAEPLTSTAEPSTSTAEPTTSTAEPSTSTAEPSTSTAEPSTSTAEPSTSTAVPSTSTAETSTSSRAAGRYDAGAAKLVALLGLLSVALVRM